MTQIATNTLPTGDPDVDARQPASENEAELIGRIDGFVQEAIDARGDLVLPGLTVTDCWKLSGRLYHGDQWKAKARKGHKQFVFNLVLNAVLTQTSAKLEQLPRPAWQPVEKGDRPVYYLSRDGGRVLANLLNAGVLQFALTPEQLGLADPEMGPTEPISDAIFGQLKMLTMPQPDGGLPLLRDDDLIEVDDDLVAKVLQREFDRLWVKCGADFIITVDDLQTNAIGNNVILYDWDFEGKVHRLDIPNILNVYLDGSHLRVEDMDFVVLDTVLPLERAKREFPEHAAALEAAKSEGAIRSAEEIDPHNYQRDVVTVRYCWQRWHEFPMSEDDALASGKVELRKLQPDAAIAGGHVAMAGEAYQTPDGAVVGMDDEGWPSEMVLSETGEPTEPGAENWPVKVGVRETHVLRSVSKVVYDGECKEWDIPIVLNRCVPVANTPWGMGLPLRMADIQAATNLAMTAAMNQLMKHMYPPQILPESLRSKLRQNDDVHTYAGRTIFLDPEEVSMFAEWMRALPGFEVPVGSFTIDSVALAETLRSLANELAGNVDVLQGKAPYAGASGRTVDKLTSNARGPIGLLSKFTEWNVERLARLMMHSIVTRTSPRDWAKYNTQYPAQVLLAIQDRAKSAEWDVKVETSTGAASNKAQGDEETKVRFQMGLLDRRTAMERLDEDPDLIEKRFQEQMEQQAQDAAAAGSPPASGLQGGAAR